MSLAAKENTIEINDHRNGRCAVQCTVFSVQCTVYSVQCTVYSVKQAEESSNH